MTVISGNKICNACWLIFLLTFLPYFITGQQLTFEHIDNRDGLSQGSINCIYQDRHGFMWFGTKDGLNKYDGISFVVYQFSLKDSTSISSNHISTITEDHEGNLWVGTVSGGLNKFDVETETFHKFTDDADSGFYISGKIISSLLFIGHDTLLVGSVGDGLTVLNIKNGKSTVYSSDPGKPESIGGNTIMDICKHPSGKIFLALREKGFSEFDLQTNKFTNYSTKDEGESILFNEKILCLDFDRKGNLWMGDFGKGLYSFNIESKEISNYKTREFERPEIQADFIQDILVIDSTIWCASQGWGLGLFDINTGKTKYYYYEPGRNKGIANNGLLSLYQSRSGIVWLGTNGKGINFANPHSKKFVTFNHENTGVFCSEYLSVRSLLEQHDTLWISGYGAFQILLPGQYKPIDLITGMNFYCLEPDRQDPNILWLGDEGSGLYRYRKKSKQLESIPGTNHQLDGHIYGTSIYSLLDDGDVLWAGTYSGLNKMDKKSGEISWFTHDPANKHSIARGGIQSILKTGKTQYWIGSNVDGISVFDGVNDYFIHYRQSDKAGSLSSNNVNSIYQDSKGNIWVCTNAGINKFNSGNFTFEAFTIEDGLPNNVVYAALEDDEGRLWLSTNMGLCCFDPDSGETRKYDAVDGLQGNEFNNGAYFKAGDGELFFGGINGFTRFYPDLIYDNPYIPPVVYTYMDIKSNNDSNHLHITNRKEIKLSFREAIFEIRFAALNFYKPEKNYYKYKLMGSVGISSDWINLDNKNYIDLVGLEPGSYKLEVIGSNNDQVWNPEAANLIINISPPFWQTWVFKGLVVVLFLLLVYAFIWLRINTIKTEREKLQRLVDEQTLELKEANEAKNKFFSIIGHDLKSPLNSVIGFSSLMEAEYDSLTDRERKDFISDINKSSETLLKLTDNLLNWARAQSRTISCRPEAVSFNNILEETIELYNHYAFKKEIALEKKVSREFMVFADRNMLQTVVRNLISNAIKFTNRGGRIRIEASEKGGVLEVAVSDNGVGITEQNINKLFRISEKIETEGTEKEKGTGLGLLLTREFVVMNGGTISVRSKTGQGSTFTFTIPIHNS